ncbi:MAG: YfcE family phosphodiesterase [Firmicutes bacterium]|nr:YfcE family phosphodiesterase [Bacillota bacterium]
MKIAVFSDIHGSPSGMDVILKIVDTERPDKTVICGDLFGGFVSLSSEVADKIRQINSTLYLVRGNNDRDGDIALLPCGMDDYAVMYHFGRTLFFTHGDVYNKYRIPPLLREGDVLVYGHTHMSLLQRFNGLYIANVGSVSRPRDDEPSYMVIEETGIVLKKLNGEIINSLSFDGQSQTNRS